MNRSLYLVILLSLICQTGCSTLFNPDKTISAALASYFPDSDAATFEMEKQLQTVVNESRRANERARSITDEVSTDGEIQDRRANYPVVVTDLPPVSPLPGQPLNRLDSSSATNSSPNNHSSSAENSWEKIEQAIEVEPDSNVRTLPRQSSFLPRNRQTRPLKNVDLVESQQEKLIEIYDEINKQEIPKNYQLLPPLIQRPLIYDGSIVEPPLKDLAETNQVPGSDISWKDSLEATIDHLKEELNSLAPKSAEANKLKKCLNVLNSVETDGSLVELVNKLTALQSTLPQHQFEAIRQIIESTESSKSNLIDELKSAVTEVTKSSELRVRNATFCMAVEGFGKFERFPTNQFRAGDEVLLYCELENFEQDKQTESDKTTNKCHLDAQVEFLDEKDATVFIESFADIKDESESDREDFYLFFRFHIPKLPPGSHKIQIRFHDKIGRKNATLERPLAFAVVERLQN